MTQQEFDDWQQQIAHAYAQEQVSAGTWPADQALGRAFAVNAELLPQGLATDGMLLLKGVLPDAMPVGRLWIGLRHPRGTPDCAFLYDIDVDVAHRGRGLERPLLRAAERVVTARGVGALELNVFSGNTAAIALYDSSGYAVTTRQMRKGLLP